MKRFPIPSALLVVSVLTATAVRAEATPELNIDSKQITVSGISAGAAMANQLHVAYSDLFSGAGMIAGLPYGCAEGSLSTAMTRCMGQTDDSLSATSLAQHIQQDFADGRVSDPSLLSDDAVWQFHGSNDKVVAEAVSGALNELYTDLIPNGNVTYVTDVPAGHNFPTPESGIDCSGSTTPFIGNCNYDAAGKMLQHLYPGLNTPSTELTTPMIQVQLNGANAAGLSETAYLFAPPACRGEKSCRLHLVLHGCGQSAQQLGTVFIEQSGYLRWAEANDIVLAFPQVMPSAPNPLACWDWWGYSGENYRWRDGAQMKAVTDWIRNLSG